MMRTWLFLLASFALGLPAFAQDGFEAFTAGGKWGFKNERGFVVIPPKYDEVWNFSEGLAPVRQAEKWGFIDESGKIVVSPQYRFTLGFCEGLACVQHKNAKWGYIDSKGKVAIPFKFDIATPFCEDLAMIKIDMNGKCGYINKKGKTVIPMKFSNASGFKDGVAYAQLEPNGKYGYINTKGDYIIAPSFDEAGLFYDGFAWVKKDSKYGYIDKTGKLVIPFNFEKAGIFKNGFAAVTANSKEGVIDKTGKFFNSIQEANELMKQGFPSYVNAQLGSFEDFLNNRNIHKIDAESLRNQVEAEVATWQVKGEFETTDQWKQRVNEQTREAKAKEIAERITQDYNKRLKEAKTEYQSRYEALAAEYCQSQSDRFASQNLVLKPYDADNQTFLISTEDFGDILLPVPLAEAQGFKSGWETTKKNVKASFVPAENDVALQSVSFGKYIYDSNTEASYVQLDVDYNFRPIEIADMNFNFDKIGDVGQPTVSVSTAHASTRRHSAEHKKVSAGNVADVDIDIPSGPGDAPNAFAVVIANGDYAHASKVANAENDGRIMSKYLSRTLGIPEKNVTTYINATYGQMASAMSHLKDISEAYGKDNFSVVFYYVGHGLPDDESRESYILPVDVDPRNTDICYPLKKLYGELGNLGAKSVTMMIDACFSGANHGDGMLVPQSMGVAIKPKKSQPIGNMVVISAAEGDETAFPYASKGHGLFTYWLLKKLQDSKGNVTLGELSDYVTDNVKKTSVVENRKRQTPTVAISPAIADSWRGMRFGR